MRSNNEKRGSKRYKAEKWQFFTWFYSLLLLAAGLAILRIMQKGVFIYLGKIALKLNPYQKRLNGDFIMSKKRLIPINVTHTGMKDLSDALYCIARDIENTFLIVGAKPGVDYTKKDLIEMAVNFAASNGDFAVDVTTYN